MAEPVIHWEGRGYFGFPPPPSHSAGDGLDTWSAIFAQAKAGDFRGIPRLIEVFRTTPRPVVQALCAIVLGDAGTPASYEEVGRALPNADLAETALQYVYILAARGRLADAPLLLQTYERFANVEESDFIAYQMSFMLEKGLDFIYDPGPFESPSAYVAVVKGRIDELTSAFGSHVCVFQGEPFSVKGLAHGVLIALQGGAFIPSLWRRKFEAATGIDCSPFYQDQVLQPLVAAAMIEEFLESPAAARYEDGVRYFFGHRIPD